MVLDCGSVIDHGPQWNPNGGDCEGRLVGRMSAADGIGALGVFSVLLTVASLPMGHKKSETFPSELRTGRYQASDFQPRGKRTARPLTVQSSRGSMIAAATALA